MNWTTHEWYTATADAIYCEVREDAQCGGWFWSATLFTGEADLTHSGHAPTADGAKRAAEDWIQSVTQVHSPEQIG